LGGGPYSTLKEPTKKRKEEGFESKGRRPKRKGNKNQRTKLLKRKIINNLVECVVVGRDSIDT